MAKRNHVFEWSKTETVSYKQYYNVLVEKNTNSEKMWLTKHDMHTFFRCILFSLIEIQAISLYFFSKLASKLKLQYQTNIGFRSKSIISGEFEYSLYYIGKHF